MRKIITLMLLMLSVSYVHAQNDTVPTTATEDVEVYDVVAVYRQGKTGRGVPYKYALELKGEILTYDSNTGQITFKGVDGKMYSFKSDEYEYYQYDKVFTKKEKKKRELNPRKEEGLSFNTGLTFGFYNVPQDFTPDEVFLNTPTYADIPLCLKLGLSKHINKQNIVGVTSEVALATQNNAYFNLGMRYQYLYNAEKNAAFYFPAELKYAYYNLNVQYDVNDTIFIDNGYMYPSTVDADVMLNAVELNIGQGLSFAMKQKKSWQMELMFVKQFILSEKFSELGYSNPNTSFDVSGLKLAFILNF